MFENETRLTRETPLVVLSQPVISRPHSSIIQALNNVKTTRREQICFSQPTHNEDLMIQVTEFKYILTHFQF